MVLENHGRIVYDPRGVVEVEDKERAKRRAKLAGLGLGVLDNSKWNAGRLLRQAARRLQRAERLGRINYYTKDSFSRNAPGELIRRISAENDIALIAIGD